MERFLEFLVVPAISNLHPRQGKGRASLRAVNRTRFSTPTDNSNYFEAIALGECGIGPILSVENFAVVFYGDRARMEAESAQQVE